MRASFTEYKCSLQVCSFLLALRARRQVSLRERGLVDPQLRASNDIHVPSKLAHCLSQGWGLIDLPLRAAFSPAHPLARQDVP